MEVEIVIILLVAVKVVNGTLGNISIVSNHYRNIKELHGLTRKQVEKSKGVHHG